MAVPHCQQLAKAPRSNCASTIAHRSNLSSICRKQSLNQVGQFVRRHTRHWHDCSSLPYLDKARAWQLHEVHAWME